MRSKFKETKTKMRCRQHEASLSKGVARIRCHQHEASPSKGVAKTRRRQKQASLGKEAEARCNAR